MSNSGLTSKEEIRKAENELAKEQTQSTGGNDSTKSKAEIIEERRTQLPLPEDPPTASDWNSADATKVNVGSGGTQSDVSYGGGSDSLRGPATSKGGSGTIGREAADGLDGPPKDAKKR